MHEYLPPDLVLQAYTQGAFPMADSATSTQVQWYCPHKRGQLSIPAMHIPRSLQKAVKQRPYRVTVNAAFSEVIRQCAAVTPDRKESWINPSIIDAFNQLHRLGHAHSVECWDGEELVGGLYGLAIGQLFCGESMFSCKPNASKIALVHLVARLHAGGFQILDTQFTNDHLEQFGVYEVPHDDYVRAIQSIISKPADFVLEGQLQNTIMQNYLKFRANQKS